MEHGFYESWQPTSTTENATATANVSCTNPLIFSPSNKKATCGARNPPVAPPEVVQIRLGRQSLGFGVAHRQERLAQPEKGPQHVAQHGLRAYLDVQGGGSRGAFQKSKTIKTNINGAIRDSSQERNSYATLNHHHHHHHHQQQQQQTYRQVLKALVEPIPLSSPAAKRRWRFIRHPSPDHGRHPTPEQRRTARCKAERDG